jgi:hypothetical protein
MERVSGEDVWNANKCCHENVPPGVGFPGAARGPESTASLEFQRIEIRSSVEVIDSLGAVC